MMSRRDRPIVADALTRIHSEWSTAERERGPEGDLPEAEAAAYQEGLLVAMECIHEARLAATQRPADESRADAHDRTEGEQRVPESLLEDDGPADCPDCGNRRVQALGEEGAVCLSCDV